MQMDIQSQGFTLTDGLRDYLKKRLAYALNHGDGYITRITVRLSDINGPRGGADKRCFIEVRLKQQPAVVIEDTEADLYVAIDRAAERAVWRGSGNSRPACLKTRIGPLKATRNQALRTHDQFINRVAACPGAKAVPDFSGTLIDYYFGVKHAKD